MSNGRRILLVVALAGLLVALVPPWVEEVRTDVHWTSIRTVSRGYSFVWAPPAPSPNSEWGRLWPDWPKLLLTWGALCLVVWSFDGTALRAARSSLTFFRRRATRQYLADHRVGCAVALALVLPVPIPLGILLVLLVPRGGFVGSGHVGVGAGGPWVLVLLVALIALLAGVLYVLLTLFLRRVGRMNVPWRFLQ